MMLDGGGLRCFFAICAAGELVVGRAIDVVDDQVVDGALLGLEFQAELLL
jgi:hypothetical protein